MNLSSSGLLLLSAVIIAAPQAVASKFSTLPAVAPAAPAARLPGFAAELSDRPLITGSKDWQAMPSSQALAQLAGAEASSRQAARWAYALSLMAEGRSPEVLGVLDVMLQDDPDLALALNFQLARGATLAALQRYQDAAVALNQPALANNAEACAWRLLAFSGAKVHAMALRQLPCALPALTSRSPRDRTPFILAAAGTALFLNRPALSEQLLSSIDARDPAANLLRSRAYFAQGQSQAARVALTRAERAGGEEQRVDARVTAIEMGVAQRSISPAAALHQLEQLRYTWRGGPIEERALRLSYNLARNLKNERAALASGSTLIRYHRLGADLPLLMRDVQATLAGLLALDGRLPIDQAAGLYWEFRDLAPGGAEGNLLVTRLADKLASLGLYVRAADLLEHQLLNQVRDVAQGPLSVRVAKLHILSGHPDRALAIMRTTADVVLPSEMIWDRQRVEAVALFQLGRGREALATLQDVPGTHGLRAELMWKQRDWQTYVAITSAELPAPRGLSEVSQAVILKHAISLGMLGREDDLAELRARYASAFATLPTADAFDLLTRDAGEIDAQSMTEAMASIPVASPAGDLADLLEMAPAGPKKARG